MSRGEAPAQLGQAFTERACASLASSQHPPLQNGPPPSFCSPPSLLPVNTHTHFICVVELPPLSPGLSDTRTTILYGGLWGRPESWGREGAGFHLPIGHHPVTFHRNLKLQISESESSPNSFHMLTSGDGTAVCLGALPTPGHLLPTAWPLLPILATSAQNTSPPA